MPVDPLDLAFMEQHVVQAKAAWRKHAQSKTWPEKISAIERMWERDAELKKAREANGGTPGERRYTQSMSATWTTLEARKTAATARISDGVTQLRSSLAAYAKSTGGKFLLYGSAARGDVRFDSDVDIILDFPPERESDAWRFVEDACRQHGLLPDIRPKRYCQQKFIAHIAHEAEEIA